MRGTELSLEVLVKDRVCREYGHQSGKTYICLNDGDEYILRIKNHSYFNRILVIPSVDGLSVMDGKSANWDRGGYVLDQHTCVDIPGFRLNNEQVAKFVVGKPEESYAALMDKPVNIGVIGVAVFTEKIKRPAHTTPPGSHVIHSEEWPRWGAQHTNKNLSTDDCKNLEREEKTCGGIGFAPELGTKFGVATEHKVENVTFERATTQPIMVMTIFYDSAKNLRKLGIFVEDHSSPNPFPENELVRQGCTPPPGWTAGG